MKKITQQEWDMIPNDYKSIYDSDHIHGTNLDGRKTWLTWIDGEGTVLLIEGESFEIISQCTN